LRILRILVSPKKAKVNETRLKLLIVFTNFPKGYLKPKLKITTQQVGPEFQAKSKPTHIP
jgi:hypothetical protein